MKAGGRRALRPAVFLDRDGVLNEVVMRDDGAVVGSPRSVEEFELVENAAHLVSRLHDAGFLVFVVTNQPDLSRGLLDPHISDSISEILLEEVGVDEVRVCPHDDQDHCGCRKPLPGMLYALAEGWGVDLEASYMVGDSWRDIDAGRAAGCRTILLRRSYNEGVSADLVVSDLVGVEESVLGKGVSDG